MATHFPSVVPIIWSLWPFTSPSSSGSERACVCTACPPPPPSLLIPARHTPAGEDARARKQTSVHLEDRRHTAVFSSGYYCCQSCGRNPSFSEITETCSFLFCLFNFFGSQNRWLCTKSLPTDHNKIFVYLKKIILWKDKSEKANKWRKSKHRGTNCSKKLIPTLKHQPAFYFKVLILSVKWTFNIYYGIFHWPTLLFHIIILRQWRN